jgi:hypothetical protein
MYLSESEIFILYTLSDACLQCLPSIFTAPLAQKFQRLKLVSIHAEILWRGPILYELALRAKPTDRSKEVVPMGSVTPDIKSCILYFRVQDGCYVNSRKISHIREEVCNLLVKNMVETWV